MRQMIKLIILLICLISISNPSYSSISGNVEYQIPIDYTKLSTEKLENKANFYYNLALKSSSGNINEEVTKALNLYNILVKKEPQEICYNINLGILYELINKDNLAKSYFNKAIGINPNNPEPYFRLGEFYYKRTLYKKALRMYKEAYKKGYTTHYETLYKIGDIYEKFGDTDASIRYLTKALKQNPNSELDNQIRRVQNEHNVNKEYYSDTRIRLKQG